MGDLSGKKIMVTSGGTREYIDEVRIITNISSGALGAKIAEELYNRGAEVFYVHTKGSHSPAENDYSCFDSQIAMQMRKNDPTLSYHRVVTANDMFEKIRGLMSGFNFDAVVHSAAISDFTFDYKGALKLSSSSPEAFIEHLRNTITQTPKIIKYIREWNPHAALVGFKFTVGCENIEANARDFLHDNMASMIVANDKVEMAKLKTHRAHLITDPGCLTCDGKEAIAIGIADFLEKRLS